VVSAIEGVKRRIEGAQSNNIGTVPRWKQPIQSACT